jgi:hypothetical protein
MFLNTTASRQARYNATSFSRARLIFSRTINRAHYLICPERDFLNLLMYNHALEPFHLSPLAPARVVPQSVQATAIPSPAQPMYYSNDFLCSGAVGCITRIAHVPRMEAGTSVSPVGSTQAMEMYTNGSTLQRAGTHSTDAGLQHTQQPLPYPSTIVRGCDTAAVGSEGLKEQ